MPIGKCLEYIEIAKLKHGTLYDYSAVPEEYTSCNNPVSIVCTKHTSTFKQSMNDHAKRGRTGCKECIADKRRSAFADTNEQFIAKAKLVYPESNHDFSKVKYVNAKTNVTITCLDHDFEITQTPDSYLQGNIKCKSCISEEKTIIVKIGVRKPKPPPKPKVQTRSMAQYRRDMQALGRIRFINRANIYHNNKFDYSQSNYINCFTKLTIICPQHGSFRQTPIEHYRYGCRKCAQIANGKALRLTKDEFIRKSNKVHDNLYGYSEVDYINNRTNVKITCETHGIFEQRPDNHMYLKCGCPRCNQSKGELAVEKYLNKHKIVFISQKRFKDCKDTNTLPFDFYIPELNVCIEYDGQQHFYPIEFFGGQEGFELVQKHDKIKDQYCYDNNIDIIRIPYTILKNMHEFLDIELEKLFIQQLERRVVVLEMQIKELQKI